MTTDKIKLAAAALILMIGVVGFYYFGDQAAYIRASVLVGAAVVGVILALTSAPGKAAVGFSRDSYKELQRVVWPTRKETIQMTLVVIALVLIIALFLWAVDSILLNLVKVLTGARS